MSEELEKKVQRAIRLIQAASKKATEVGQPVEVSYSGGKDSDVILELTRMANVPYKAIYKNTTIDPSGTIKHAKEVGAEIMQPKQTFRQLIEQKGLPNRWRRFCCSVIKEYKVLDYMILGIRREESRARKDRYQEPEICRVYSKKSKARQYLPILDWTANDIAQFIAERGIKCHPLYYDADGKFHADRRLGCLCCPLMSKNKRVQSFKENPRMVRFYIESAKKYLMRKPDGRIARIFNGNVYDWFTTNVFCEGEREFRERFGATLFDNGIDTKKFLEQQFHIKL